MHSYVLLQFSKNKFPSNDKLGTNSESKKLEMKSFETYETNVVTTSQEKSQTIDATEKEIEQKSEKEIDAANTETNLKDQQTELTKVQTEEPNTTTDQRLIEKNADSSTEMQAKAVHTTKGEQAKEERVEQQQDSKNVDEKDNFVTPPPTPSIKRELSVYSYEEILKSAKRN